MGSKKTVRGSVSKSVFLTTSVLLGFFVLVLINLPLQDAAAGANEPAIGEISWTATNFAPRGTANCDGQLLAINSNQALFSLFGTTYGGDGEVTFGLPELRGRMPLDDGSGPGLSPRSLGEKSGSESVTLTNQNIPSHTHTLKASGTSGDLSNPAGNVLGTGIHPFTHRIFSSQTANTPLDNQALTSTGGSQSHNNMNPFLTIRCLVNLIGVFPSDDGGLMDPIIGEVRFVGFNFAPGGWAKCEGQLLPIQQHTALFSRIGTTYGGDGETTFGLPDMRGRIPMHQGPLHNIGERGGEERVTLTTAEIPSHTHQLRAFNDNADTTNPSSTVLSGSQSNVYAPANNLVSMHGSSIQPTGSSGSHENMPPFQGLNCIIALTGTFPTGEDPLGSPFISEIKWLAHDFVPTNFERCNGQLLPIAQNDAFFSLVGTIYGGDGEVTFGVPDMRDRMPVHVGSGPGLTPRTQGSTGGTEAVTLTTSQLPSHTHSVQAFDEPGDDNDPTNKAMHKGSHPFLHRIYNTQNPDVDMAPSAVAPAGGSQPHNNIPPYLTINCIVAKTGVFPTEN